MPQPLTSPPQEDPRRAEKIPHSRRLPEQGHRAVTIAANGTVSLKGVNFPVSHPLAEQVIHAVTFADSDGLVEHNWPPQGVSYVSTHPPGDTTNRAGRPRKNLHPTQVTPKS